MDSFWVLCSVIWEGWYIGCDGAYGSVVDDTKGTLVFKKKTGENLSVYGLRCKDKKKNTMAQLEQLQVNTILAAKIIIRNHSPKDNHNFCN